MGLVQLAVILGCATLILGQSFPRKCSEIDTMKNFDTGKFTGLWYEITARMNIVGESGECPTIRYSSLSNNALEIKNKVCFLNNQLTITGKLEPVNVAEGQFTINYPVVNNDTIPLLILATDYTNYSIVGACAYDYLGVIAIHARTSKLEGASKDTVSAIVKNMTGEDLDKMFHSKHENCCYDATAERV